jgi:beta-aspartyl-peptidase (threonine type)
MDGSGLRCGAVARVRTVKNPITLARYVMERTQHVLLVGDGAEKLAEAQGLEPVPPSYFDTEAREAQWQRAHVDDKGTVGAVALDQRGHLAAATSTGGLNCKLHGRVGDSAIIGAGTYANDKTCAISSTGIGEEFIRHVAAHQVSALMQYSGLSLHQAADQVVNEVMRRDDGGVIGVSRTGKLVGVFNTEGMFRGFADARGRLEVLVW